MQILLIFLVVWVAMIAHSFWESSVEGKNAWGKNKYGWNLKLAKNLSLTRYHFWLFVVYMPLIFILLPLVVTGFSIKLFGILLSAYFSGIVIEDFFWFIVNTEIKFKDSWNPKFASYYPWIGFGKYKVPLFYVLGFSIAVVIYFLLVK